MNKILLLQDFKEYRSKMELFFTAAKAVEAHTGDPAGRSAQGHAVCTSCRQEKAMVVMLGGEEMNKLFQYVGKVLDEDRSRPRAGPALGTHI